MLGHRTATHDYTTVQSDSVDEAYRESNLINISESDDDEERTGMIGRDG